MTQIDIVGIDTVRAKRPQYVPIVLTKQEAIAVIQQGDGIDQRTQLGGDSSMARPLSYADILKQTVQVATVNQPRLQAIELYPDLPRSL